MSDLFAAAAGITPPTGNPFADYATAERLAGKALGVAGGAREATGEHSLPNGLAS
jgi:hypothetical protein